MITGLGSLFVIMAIAAATPILLGLFPRIGVPAVVVFLIAGIAVGPEGLAIAKPDDVTLLSNVGLGFLFLLAGYEIKLSWFVARSGRLAVVGWGVSVAISAAVTYALYQSGIVTDFEVVVLALTTTALGTLLPILRDAGMLRGRFREYVLATGAVGELFPIIAIALLLGSGGQFAGLFSLLAIGLVALILVVVQAKLADTRVGHVVRLRADSTSQTLLRLTLAMLLGLLFVAAEFGIDVVLGAFVAGMVLRRWGPSDPKAFDAKLDAVGYGFFIPIFFVVSGMTIDIDGIKEAPERLFIFFVLMLLIRGLPTMALYRKELRLQARASLTFIAATGLPLIVALTQIGVDSGLMLTENASALVGAGALSVLVYPLVANLFHGRDARAHPEDYDITLDDEAELLPDLLDESSSKAAPNRE